MIHAMNFRAAGPRVRQCIAALIAVLSLQTSAGAAYVTFHDANLRQAVWTALGNAGNAGSITDTEMLGLVTLNAANRGIADLTGLEFATGLQTLNLAGNFVDDIEPLAGLTSLQSLDLTSNFVEDLTPLAGLTNLTMLILTSNGESTTPRWLSDITPLAGLKNLQTLNLSYNRVIEDIGALGGLTGLKNLYLQFNRVRDIGPLYNLTDLEHLELQVNEITNISALAHLPNLNFLNLAVNEIRGADAIASNSGIGSGDTVILTGNPLNRRARVLAGTLAANVLISNANFGVNETNFVDVILDRKSPIPTQIDLAQFDYNIDGSVDVSDLLRFKDTRAGVTVPVLVSEADPRTIENAIFRLNQRSLLLGRVDTAPLVMTPAVQVVSQSIKNGNTVAPGEKVDVTVAIPPDGLEFLQLQDFPHAPEDELSAISYYASIDPDNKKDTLEKFLHENRVGQPGGITADTVYFNAYDLGFGRQMHMRQDSQGTVFWVLNHDTVDDAWQSQKNPFATVAMEYSPGPEGGEPFVKFYAYDKNNQRLLKINLDGRGEKYLPNNCMPCHGGTPRRFYDDGLGGNTGARFIGFDLDTFEYSAKSEKYSRDAQESEFKKMNRAVLESLQGIASDFGTDTAAATELLEGWYGGPGLPGDFDGSFIPPGWLGTAGESIYTNVIAETCRACHVQLTSFQFDTFAGFDSVKSTVKERIFDEGVMPKALRTYKRFWTHPEDDYLAELAAFVGAPVGSGPGRPVAKIARKGGTLAVNQPIDLDASGSFFADSFEWSFNPNAINSTIDNPTAEKTFFVPPIPGEYIIRLKVFKDGMESAFASESIVVGTVPTYADVKTAIASCIDCHNTVSQDGGLALDRLDDLDNYDEIIARSVLSPVSLVETSPFLRKGAGFDGHLGGTQPGWNTAGTITQRQHYDTVFAYLAAGAAPPPSTTPDPPTFNQLEALFTAPEVSGETVASARSCLPCHGDTNNANGVDWLFNPTNRRADILPYIDLEFPENSVFLQKASGQVTHNGSTTPIPGFDLNGDMSKYALVVAWIQDGAPDRGVGEFIPSTFTTIDSLITSKGCATAGCHDINHIDGFDLNVAAATRWSEITSEVASDSGETRRVNLFTPSNSLLYRKVQGELSHTGGTVITNTNELNFIFRWIDDGAMNN